MCSNLMPVSSAAAPTVTSVMSLLLLCSDPSNACDFTLQPAVKRTQLVGERRIAARVSSKHNESVGVGIFRDESLSRKRRVVRVP